MSRKRILILAQTPPPFHGQAVMQSHLVAAQWNWCEKKHIRLNFSDAIEEVGKPAVFKLWRLLIVLSRLLAERFRGRIDVVFYPPSGPHRVPFLRDVVILLFTRLLAHKLILQFHAGGFDRLQWILSGFERRLAHKAYASADAALVLLPTLSTEVQWIQPKRIIVVPNGIEDNNTVVRIPDKHTVTTILYVGSLSRKKGILDALDACAILRGNGLAFHFRVVGEFVSPEMRDLALNRVSNLGLVDTVVFTGPKNGDEKWSEYRSADLFCFPSYEMENFPVVLLEAMQFGLPIVATRWRSIPDLVAEGENGLLFEPQKPDDLASKLQTLLVNQDLRTALGKRGREKYLSSYTLAGHLEKMEDAFKTVAAA